MKTARNVSMLVAPLLLTMAVQVFAHEMTVMGTVTAIEQTRIQVKTGKEHVGQEPAWYPIDAKTKIKRGKKTVTFEEAKIKTDERAVLIVDHPDKGPMRTKEIRLAAQET